MLDLVFLLIVVAFFALAVVFVRACALVLGQATTLDEERAS